MIVLHDIRASMQRLGDDSRVRDDALSFKIQSLMDWSEMVSQYLYLPPLLMVEGSHPDIPIVPPYNLTPGEIIEGTTSQLEGDIASKA